jgi:hypothetical protein
MLKAHFRIAREGLPGMRLLKREYEARGREAPHGRKFVTEAEFLARIEPLMEHIAAGDLPADDPTTAEIVRRRLEVDYKDLKQLLGEDEDE